METDIKYMRRALDLARKGNLYAHPNPMVGAVIVGNDGQIIGEGYHRKCGEAHAEVNAVASVADKQQLKDSTMYVTLEPCAHYGRTGPCAKLIIDCEIPRVVVATRDPFDKVDGRGIEMLREAGVEVEIGMLGEESRKLNAKFFTAHTQHRPFVMLKWAQTADGFLDVKRQPGESPLAVSSPLTRALGHKLRAEYDAILVGSGTVLADNPTLDNRLWSGPSPRPVILDRRGRVGASCKIMESNPIVMREDLPLSDILSLLYQQGISSVLVEGGAMVHQAFVEANLWDVIRVETSQETVGEKGVAPAPALQGMQPAKTISYDEQTVKFYVQNSLVDVKNL